MFLLGARVKAIISPSLSLRRCLVPTGVVLLEGLPLGVFIKKSKDESLNEKLADTNVLGTLGCLLWPRGDRMMTWE